AEFERVTAKDFRNVIVNVVVALDVARRQKYLSPEGAEAFDIQLRSDRIVRQKGRPCVADLQFQVVECSAAELIIMRRQHGPAETVEFAATRNGDERAGCLILEDAVGDVEAQVTRAAVAEAVVQTRRELCLVFLERKLSRGVGEELDGSRIGG